MDPTSSSFFSAARRSANLESDLELRHPIEPGHFAATIQSPHSKPRTMTRRIAIGFWKDCAGISTKRDAGCGQVDEVAACGTLTLVNTRSSIIL